MSTTSAAGISRLAKIRGFISQANIDGIVVTTRLNVAYLSGFHGSAGYLLITQKDAILITDSRYTLAAAQESPEFTVVTSAGSGGYTDALAQEIGKLAGVAKLGFEKNDVTYGLWESWSEAIPDSVGLVTTSDAVENLRQIKDLDEVDAIRKAIDIAQNAFLAVKHLLAPGTQERAFARALEDAMRDLGATAPSFDTIVAGGPQGARPHHHANNRTFVDGDLVTIDWGAIVDGYCSDITRAVLIGPTGQATAKQEQIHALVLEAQRRAIAAIKPGKTGKEIDAVARDFLTEQGYGEAFSHSLGHSLGLEVHDGPGFSTRSDLVLAPGMVLTVEPGIYLAGWGGARIEEDVLVTESGCEVLTSLPQSIIF